MAKPLQRHEVALKGFDPGNVIHRSAQALEYLSKEERPVLALSYAVALLV
ncbi:hypothetical protein [Candidatus Phyllobacterium onerii]|nr:hypothetical protein [Phyllobacterium sp. IY22]